MSQLAIFVLHVIVTPIASRARPRHRPRDSDPSAIPNHSSATGRGNVFYASSLKIYAMDTEILLAMLVSLLDPAPVPDQATLLDALAQCDGNVEEAAKRLIDKSVPRVAGQKRKRAAGLDEWFGGSPSKAKARGPSKNGSKPPSSSYANADDQRADTDNSNAPKKPPLTDLRDESPERRPLASSSTSGTAGESSTASPRAKPTSSSKRRDVTNGELLSLLRPPNSKETGKKPAQLPPLTLGTPSLVEEHTPCTSHPSVLPPELACRYVTPFICAPIEWKREVHVAW